MTTESASEARGESRCRVLHVISGRMFGGGQRVVHDLVRTLPRVAQVEVELCLLGQSHDFFRGLSPTIVPFEGNYRNPWVAWPASRRLRDVLRRCEPDILHTHGFDAELIGALAVRGLPIRHLSHVHDTPGWIASPRLKHRIRRRITRFILNRSQTSFVAVSEATRTYVCDHMSWPAERVQVVHNGIDTQRYRCDGRSASEGRLSGRHLVLGTAARLAANKGIDTVLKALALLRQEGLQAELRIAGTGPLLSSLQQLARELDIDESVRFLGLVDDMPGFYEGLDVFVLASRSGEGLPLTVLEAMSMGLPVLATPIMGVPEAVRDGVDGLLFPPGDPEALARALARTARDANLRHCMGRSGRQRVLSRFTVEQMTRGVAETYKKSAPLVWTR